MSFMRGYEGFQKIQPQCDHHRPFEAEYGSCLGSSVKLSVSPLPHQDPVGAADVC